MAFWFKATQTNTNAKALYIHLDDITAVVRKPDDTATIHLSRGGSPYYLGVADSLRLYTALDAEIQHPSAMLLPALSEEEVTE